MTIDADAQDAIPVTLAPARAGFDAHVTYPPDGGEALTATGDFNGILFPFCTQPGRGIPDREAPLERTAERVISRTTLVAVSALQSANGPVADVQAPQRDVPGMGRARRWHGAR